MDAPAAVKLTLRKNDKLRNKADFEQVRSEGKKFVGRGFLLVCAEAPDRHPRCGVICSRRYSKLAVHRNRARRLLFEAFRLMKPEFRAIHLILIPRMGMRRYVLSDTVAEMRRLAKQAGILPASQTQS